MTLTSLSTRDLLDAFRSSEPTPGGGSASALAAALGAALLAMVAGLPRPRAAGPDDLARLTAAGQRAAQLSRELEALVDRDSEAYTRVMAAYRLPKAAEEEKQARTAAIQAALLEAIAAPLDVMRLGAAALDAGADVAAGGNRSASSDVLVAVELLAAGIRGARLNVAINLDGLRDAGRAGEIRGEVERLLAKAEAGAAAARSRLAGGG